MPCHKVHILNHTFKVKIVPHGIFWGWLGYKDAALLHGVSTLTEAPWGSPCSTMWACHLWYGKQAFIRQFAGALTLDFQKICEKKNLLFTRYSYMRFEYNNHNRHQPDLKSHMESEHYWSLCVLAQPSTVSAPCHLCPLWPRALSDLNSYIWLLIATTFSFCKEVRL